MKGLRCQFQKVTPIPFFRVLQEALFKSLSSSWVSSKILTYKIFQQLKLKTCSSAPWKSFRKTRQNGVTFRMTSSFCRTYCICEIRFIALDGFSLNTVHKLISKVSAESGFVLGDTGWEARMLPLCYTALPADLILKSTMYILLCNKKY